MPPNKLGNINFVSEKMMSKSLDIESVKHDPQRKKFILNIPGSDSAFLEYDFLDRDHTLVDMSKTFVPSQRGCEETIYFAICSVY